MAEGDRNGFVVTLSAGNVATIVDLQLSGGSAAIGGDTGQVRVVVNGTGQIAAVDPDGKFSVQLPAGTTTFQVLVEAADDYLAESPEDYTLSATANDTLATGVAKITDETAPSTEDTVYAQIEADKSSVAEGGLLTYTVSLVDKDGNAVSMPAGKEVTLNLSWSGDAANDGDSGKLPTSVTIGADDSASLTVTARDDYLQEGSEALVASITGTGSNTAFEQVGIASGKGVASSAVTDEAVPGVEDTVYARIEADKDSVAEGGRLTYTVSLVDKDGNAVSMPVGKEVTLNLLWSGAAANDDDTSGRPASVTIGADGRASFTVTANNDDQREDSEMLVATLSSVGTNTAFEQIVVSGDKSAASSSITDVAPLVPVPVPGLADTVYARIVVDKSSVAEGGRLTYTVSLVDKDGKAVSMPAGKEVTLNLSWSGDAANDGDTTDRPSSVTIGADGTAVFSVDARDDNLQEGSEGLVATLSSIGSNTAFGTIAISASNGAASSEVTDGSGGEPQPPLDSVSAQIVVDKSSVAEGGRLTYTVSLVDKDGKAVSMPAGKEVTLNLSWSGDAANDGDTTDRPSSVTIGADGTAVFSVDARDDNLKEGSEGLVATLSSIGSNTAFGTIAIPADKSTASSVVIDESGDEPQNPLDSPFTLQLFAVTADGQLLNGDSTVSEDGETSAYYVVRAVDDQGNVLATQPTGNVSVSFGNLGSTSDSDYSASKTTVAVGEVFSAQAVNDALADSGEQFRVSLNGSSYSAAANYEKVGYGSATITTTIIDDEIITVSPATLQTAEDVEVVLDWAVFGISDAGTTVRVSGNQNGNGTIQYKDASGEFKVLGQDETVTFSKSEIDAGNAKFVPKEHVSGADLYGADKGVGNKGSDLGSIKFDVLKDGVEIAHGKEVIVDVVPVADLPLLSLSAYQSLAAMDFDGVNLNGSAWSSAIDLNTVGGASGIGTWHADGWGKIEVGKESVYIPGGSGSNQVLEIEGNNNVSQIYTDIQCEAGRFYQLNFDVGARTTGNRPLSTCGMKILLVQLDASGNPVTGSQKELFDFSPTQVGWAKGQQLSLGIEQSGNYRLIFQSKDAGDSYGAILDNIKFQAVDNKGYEDSFIKLSTINAALVDVDGSETLSVVISGLPVGAVLKDAAGHSVTIGEDGKADVSGWNLSSLQIKVNDPGNYNLLVKATATEVDASGKVLDTEENEITLPVAVLPASAAPVAIASQADDATVTEGSTTVHGSILANDGIAGTVTKLYVSRDGGSTKLEVAAGGTELDTGHGKVTIRPDGSYTFVASVVNHSGDADNKVSDSFSYKAVTANGETAWTAVSVNVLDTNPVAVDDYAAGSTAGTMLSGNVLTNDAAVDGGESVTGFSYLGKNYAAGATTDDGRFTLDANGNYTLKALAATLDGAPTDQQLASGKVGSFELTGLAGDPPSSISSFSAGQNLGYNSSGASSGKVGWAVGAAHEPRATVDVNETLLVKLGGTASQVTLTIAELNAGTAKLVAYDAAGNKIVLVDDTITSDEVGNSGKPADFTAISQDGTPIAYVAMTYESINSNGNNSQGFVLKGMSYTELLKPASIEYTMKDADGDTDKARLTLDVAQVLGSSGNDQITVLHGEADTGLNVWAQLQLPSGASTQMVQTGSTNQVIDSKGGNDYVEGGAGNDIIYLGDSGSETIAGHAPTQADVLKMGLMTIDGLGDLVTDASDNSLSTAARTYHGTTGSTGLAWADLAHGGSGNDVIHGQAGVDLVYGGSGDDTLLGGSGDDGLRGGAGGDLLIGGQGNDVLRGDIGTDIFKWQLGDQGTAGTPARDVVMDFNVAEGDQLDLADLLQGENAGNLEQYLHFTASGSDTLVQISSAGAFKNGNYSTATDQQTLLKGVALSSLALDTSSDNHIITELLKNNLKTD
ncbi:type I secretion C-terminal target domain-containing protein [Vogesella fluminis]|uniref:calcium-binding protein n=1 Tax=Vogesella fluminis TaxID=1069161 RepID=UPI003630AD86